MLALYVKQWLCMNLNNVKFRAWHKEYKRMLKVINLEWLGDEFESLFKVCTWHDGDSIFGTHYDPREVELMQWTGLQEKNEVDIYEGDILCYDQGGGVDTFIIERNPDDHQLQARYLYMSGYNTDYLAEAPYEDSVIVGNCFENPELLEETNG